MYFPDDFILWQRGRIVHAVLFHFADVRSARREPAQNYVGGATGQTTLDDRTENQFRTTRLVIPKNVIIIIVIIIKYIRNNILYRLYSDDDNNIL